MGLVPLRVPVPPENPVYVTGLINYWHFKWPKLLINSFFFVRRHLQEHLRDTANFDLENASTEELEFHYFK